MTETTTDEPEGQRSGVTVGQLRGLNPEALSVALSPRTKAAIIASFGSIQPSTSAAVAKMLAQQQRPAWTMHAAFAAAALDPLVGKNMRFIQEALVQSLISGIKPSMDQLTGQVLKDFAKAWGPAYPHIKAWRFPLQNGAAIAVEPEPVATTQAAVSTPRGDGALWVLRPVDILPLAAAAGELLDAARSGSSEAQMRAGWLLILIAIFMIQQNWKDPNG